MISIFVISSSNAAPSETYGSLFPTLSQVSEAKLKDRASALISTGMAKLNYSYVCIDDIWAAASRDPSNGTLIPDPGRFPSGMRALSEWMHQRGLKVRESPVSSRAL